MVGGVDRGLSGIIPGNHRGKAGAGINADGVGLQEAVTWIVIDGGCEVLDERAVEPDIESLHAIADGEDGLVEAEGFLEEQLVNGCSGGVGRGALGNGDFAVTLRVHVEVAAGQKHSLDTDKQAGDPVLMLVEGNEDGGGPGGTEGGQISGQGALVEG
jgi:hypothetical protein